MFSATVGQTLRTYRTRSGRSTGDIAQAAGISAQQYEALESGAGWPGSQAFTAAVDALQIPTEARSRTGLDFCGRPLGTAITATLKGFTVPAIVVDHAWRIVGANHEATGLLPELGRPGWSLLRWILCSPEAHRRLVNAADVAGTFAAVLREALALTPFDPGLRALYEEITPDLWARGATEVADVDGLDLVWRTDNGPYQMVSLFVSVPARRPDLRQIALHIEPLLLPGQDLDSTQWPEAVLAGIAHCAVCQSAMVYEWGPVYRCPQDCFTPVAASVLEDEVAQLLLPRVYTDGALAGLARLQEILVACGSEPALSSPVSLRHALYQWRHQMPVSARRELVASWVARVAVGGGGAATEAGLVLDICWLPGP
ncbi:helix-turn-helix transcriptional regulator [Streptomyces sp. NPDC006367]|uniref:helix-turn-helix transcriptional regulator n=1 Tax=unclassified Streptomyces TaxID=2593676 RepID=UPI0033A76762